MLENVKIGKKLIGGFVLTIIIMLIIAGTGYYFITNLDDESDSMYTDRLIPIQELGIINGAFYKIRGDVYKSIILPEEREKSLQGVSDSFATVNQQLLKYEESAMTTEESKMFDAFKSAFANYESEVGKSVALIKANKEKEAIDSLAVGTPVSDARIKTDEGLNGLINLNVKLAEEIKQEQDANAAAAKTLMIVVTLIGAVIGIGFAIALTRSITIPLEKGVAMVQEVGLGHLSHRLNLNRKDEIGTLAKAIDTFADDLQNIIIAAMNQIAEGNLSINVTPKDSEDEVSPAMVKMLEALRGLVTEANMLSKAAVEGKLSTRGDVSKFKGGYREIVEGVNATLEAVVIPVNEAMRVSGSFAKGNYTDRVSEKINVQGDFIQFRDALNQIGIQGSRAIGGVKSEVDSLLAAMEETSASVEEVTAGAQSVAHNVGVVSDLSEKSGAGVTQVLQAMNDLSVTVSAVAGQANEVANLTQETDDLSKQGATLVGRTDQGMQKISASFNETDQVIGEIGKQMEDIGTIVNVISSIADQTNLLALNAAIEAARAGDAGLGFAVVADEVKSLALESQQSAEKIAGLISELQKKSRAVTESMKASQHDVEEGTVAVKETLAVFNKIAGAIGNVSIRVGEVAGASEEQAASVQEISASVHELGNLIEQAAKEAVDSSAATEEASAALDQITRVITDATASVQRISTSMGQFAT